MIIILSPSKTIDQSDIVTHSEFSIPVYKDRALTIVNKLRKFNTNDLSRVLNTSPKLARLTYDRYQFWNEDHNVQNSKQAILSFKGDVYTGLDASTLDKNDLEYAQSHLIILSGLYGVLKSLDLIQPYRLEIATKFSVGRSKNLYEFWKTKITDEIINLLNNSLPQVLINLASNEYYKSIDIKKLNVRIVTPVFKEYKNGDYKVVSIFAKKARGTMTRYIITNRINNPEDLRGFDFDGYCFNADLSGEDEFVFTRG